jgi:hypothetical protein
MLSLEHLHEASITLGLRDERALAAIATDADGAGAPRAIRHVEALSNEAAADVLSCAMLAALTHHTGVVEMVLFARDCREAEVALERVRTLVSAHLPATASVVYNNREAFGAATTAEPPCRVTVRCFARNVRTLLGVGGHIMLVNFAGASAEDSAALNDLASATAVVKYARMLLYGTRVDE